VKGGVVVQQPYSWNGITNGYIAPDWNAWLQRLQQSEQQLKQMTEQLSQLQKQLEQIKSKPPIHIEYHFDQLKVNRLEGTLNVGLTPQDIQGIESFEAPDPACITPKAEPNQQAEPPISGLQNQMNEYMNNHASDQLIVMEREYGVTLDENHRTRIVDDVKKQLKERVHYYARTVPYPSKGTEVELYEWNQTINEKTIRDIQSAFSAYLQKLKNQPT
jgi:spore germination protein PC